MSINVRIVRVKLQVWVPYYLLGPSLLLLLGYSQSKGRMLQRWLTHSISQAPGHQSLVMSPHESPSSKAIDSQFRTERVPLFQSVVCSLQFYGFPSSNKKWGVCKFVPGWITTKVRLGSECARPSGAMSRLAQGIPGPKSGRHSTGRNKRYLRGKTKIFWHWSSLLNLLRVIVHPLWIMLRSVLES